MITPFKNDPCAIILLAYQKHYDKPCEIYYDDRDEGQKGCGFTNFPDDGSMPQVYVFADQTVYVISETLAHELAHVAVGVEHGHDDEWEAAFDTLHREYEGMLMKMAMGKELMENE